ncbi:chondroadherin-like b [Paramormyrops kingsleyae]|uniref:chondroadherin-like b n=1 Tax=Paramormyrops kingsleyae TaxID=1676925 RepID=UPI003B97B545
MAQACPMQRAVLSWAAVALLRLLCVTAVRPSRCPRVCVCDSIQLTVTCANKNLTQVPPAINEITLKLDLKGNTIQELPTGAFQHTPYLTHLSLLRCGIQRVRVGAFRGLGRLVHLNLASNKIAILYQESFDGLSSLKQLLLDHNLVEEIQPGAFSQLSSVSLLSLAQNRLVYLPNMAFQGLQAIKWLRLSHNSLNNLAVEAFAGLFTLLRLSLDHNELQFFPTSPMTRLPELTRLELSHNPMTYLGEETVVMPKLAHLLLDHMSLQDFSQMALTSAPRLAHLDLSHNQLRILHPLLGPESLSRLNLTGNPVYCSCYLRPLMEWSIRGRVRLLGACAGPPYLSGENLGAIHPPDLRCQSQEAMLKAEMEEMNSSALLTTPQPRYKVQCPANCVCEGETNHSTCENRGHTTVPRGFPPDTSLLDLRENHFHYIPSQSFTGLAQVVSLHLQRCKIHELVQGAFSGMRSLVYLYLSENDLSVLSAEAFKGVPELTYLHLERNKFAKFPCGAFQLLPNLLVLHLENNTIANLGRGILADTKRLTGLYLAGNNISTVAPGAFEPAPALNTLHLSSNQLREVPSDALAKVANLAELRLSENPVRWVGPRAFLSLADSLKHLYLDGMGLEKMSKDSLAGLGSGLRSLLLEGNQLEALPSLSPLTGLEVINLSGNPLMCDCTLLPLRKWIESVNLKVRATCGHPPQLRGKKVKDVQIFKSCPGEKPLATPTPTTSQIVKSTKNRRIKTPKSKKPKSAHIKSPKAKKPTSAHIHKSTRLQTT